MQRHSVLFIPSRICASVGFGILVEQRLGGHDLPVLAKAALRDLFVDPGLLQRVQLTVLASPSSVVISLFTEDTGVMHDRIAAPLTITVHAPHWPSPQPNRGPCKPRSLRRI